MLKSCILSINHEAVNVVYFMRSQSCIVVDQASKQQIIVVCWVTTGEFCGLMAAAKTLVKRKNTKEKIYIYKYECFRSWASIEFSDWWLKLSSSVALIVRWSISQWHKEHGTIPMHIKPSFSRRIHAALILLIKSKDDWDRPQNDCTTFPPLYSTG